MRRLFTFHGGVKPDYHKEASSQAPIADVSLPNEFVVPLQQSIGGQPRPLVAVGARVLAGQCIAAPDGPVSSAVHAPTSGWVRAITPRITPHASGLRAPCVIIEPDGEDRHVEPTPQAWRTLDPVTARNALCDAGVVGLGGAVFPSHLKVNKPKGAGLSTLVINGAECEPYITCDDMQMREDAAGIVQGAEILGTLTAAERILVAIEDNKPEALAAMRSAAAKQNSEILLEVVAIPTRYPAGGAKQLMKVLTGIEVPHGKRSNDFGLQCFNTGTAFAVYEALALGKPMIGRVTTVAGAVRQPRNFRVRFGTPMHHVIAAAGGALPEADRIIMGGPMMGIRMPGAEVPVVKACNCILLASPTLFPLPPPEMACIRCGECARACPADLQPFEMYWYARARLYGKAQEYHLFDCIECGCCAYVCPSNIPLVDYYRHAKSEIWAREAEKSASDAARARYEFRLLREARDKEEKAARLAAKAAETQAKLAAEANGNAATLIAQAGARVAAQAETPAASTSAAPTP